MWVSKSQWQLAKSIIVSYDLNIYIANHKYMWILAPPPHTHTNTHAQRKKYQAGYVIAIHVPLLIVTVDLPGRKQILCINII